MMSGFLYSVNFANVSKVPNLVFLITVAEYNNVYYTIIGYNYIIQL